MTRQVNILEIIVREGKISVANLSELLKVSQVTVRKDLDELSAKGLIKREHGYAVAIDEDNISYRLSDNYLVKLNIAKRASEMVKDGETIMIESGSTCVLLAEELAKTKYSINIITNSIFISNYLKEYKNAKVILLGGEIQSSAQVTVGPLTKSCASQFKVDKIFLGTDGFNKEIGFTGKDILRVDTVKSMAENAREIIILTDSRKFKINGVVKQMAPTEVSKIVTDDEIDEDTLEFLKESGIEINLINKNQ